MHVQNLGGGMLRLWALVCCEFSCPPCTVQLRAISVCPMCPCAMVTPTANPSLPSTASCCRAAFGQAHPPRNLMLYVGAGGAMMFMPHVCVYCVFACCSCARTLLCARVRWGPSGRGTHLCACDLGPGCVACRTNRRVHPVQHLAGDSACAAATTYTTTLAQHFPADARPRPDGDVLPQRRCGIQSSWHAPARGRRRSFRSWLVRAAEQRARTRCQR